MNKFTSLNGRIVHTFDWAEAQKTHGGPAWGVMGPAYSALMDLTDAGIARASELKGDPAYTPIGRRQQMAEWFKANAVPKVKAARNALAINEREIEATRAKMTGAAIDKTDVAGAMLRSEIRSWLRGMDPAKRNAMIVTGELPQTAAIAILEAPAELSGVSRQQHGKLQESVLEVAHPAEAARIRAMEEGAQALASMERAAVLNLIEATGLGRGEIDEMTGALPLSERIRQIVEGDQPHAAPDPAEEAA
jgi:hypothetical protein